MYPKRNNPKIYTHTRIFEKHNKRTHAVLTSSSVRGPDALSPRARLSAIISWSERSALPDSVEESESSSNRELHLQDFS